MAKARILNQNRLGEKGKVSSLLGEKLSPSTLQLVEIYFDTATFDDIERDKKIKTEAQLSLIGGTMGLLTGFSIISGVEIVYFLLRLISVIISFRGLNLKAPIVFKLNLKIHFSRMICSLRTWLKLFDCIKTIRCKLCTKRTSI